MPDRCPSRCSTVTSSAMSGRSSPSSERAVVPSARVPSSTRLMTASAVMPFEPLAMATCESTAMGIPCRRSASP